MTLQRLEDVLMDRSTLGDSLPAINDFFLLYLKHFIKLLSSKSLEPEAFSIRHTLLKTKCNSFLPILGFAKNSFEKRQAAKRVPRGFREFCT
jgi:hypothetical protein